MKDKAVKGLDSLDLRTEHLCHCIFVASSPVLLPPLEMVSTDVVTTPVSNWLLAFA